MSFKHVASGLDHHHSPLVPSYPLTYLHIFLLYCALLLIQQTNAGCYQHRLCCAGRNSSCKSTEDPFPQFSTSFQQQQRGRIKLLEMRAGEQLPTVYTKENEKIGRLVLPDMVELQGKGVDFAHQIGQRNYLRTYEEITEWQEEHMLVFGTELEDQPNPDKLVFHEKGRPLIRYSLLNKHVPLKVVKVKRIAQVAPSLSHEQHQKSAEEKDKRVVVYLSDESADSLHCYCDEFCVKVGDCCADYSFFCPPADCQVSSWSTWSVECVASQGCEHGTQQRHRLILSHPSNGGAKCPRLMDNRACFRDCSTPPPPSYESRTQPDIKTVALLLDYQYNSSRVGRPIGHANSSSSYWKDLGKRVDKEKNTYYCVQYQLGWINRNCVERKWKSKLSSKKVICAECQPEAQLHRHSPRCASDLENGEKGFWKLIGPLSCSGIWRRISRTDECKCFEKFPSLTPFLLV